MLGSLSSMERWSVTKHIQCFLLMSHDCLPTLFWIYKLKGQSCKHPLHYSLMPSFSSMPIFGGIKNAAELTGCDQDCLVHSIWCSIGEAIGGASVLGFPVSSLSDFCGFSICSLWHFRLWTSEPSTNLLETRATSVSVMTFSEPKWPYHVIHWLQDCCCLHQRSRGLKE